MDTHIFRVTKRLGWIPPRASREQAHAILESLAAPEIYYPLHLNLIAHGRAVCPLRRACNYYQSVVRDRTG